MNEQGRMSLAQRVVVITGASSGFGADIARKAVAAGARVVLAARTTEKLDALVGELGGAAHALAVTADVTSDADIAHLVATANAYGQVDTVINNAGFGILDTVVDAPLADLQRIMDVNVYGAVRCTRAFLPGMIARGNGQIVMMASMAGLVAARNMAYYCASKFALVAIGRTLQQELNGTGVACTIICPGVAQTGFQAHAPNEKYPKAAALSTCTSDQVATAVITALRRRTMGEVIVPGTSALLARFSAAFPGISRAIQNMIG
jgi:short-subunit dehydrogenase